MTYEKNNFPCNLYSKYLLSSSSNFKYEDYEYILTHPSRFAKNSLYYITQISDIVTKFPFYYKLNSFNSYCILYSLSGQSKLSYKGHSYIIKPNTVLFIDCNFPHSIEINGNEKLHLQIIYLSGSNIDYFYNNFSENNYFTCSLQTLSNIPLIFQKLFKLCKQNSKYSELLISNLITSLLTSLLLNKEQNINNKKNAPKYILDIKSLLDNNYDHSYSLDEIAKQYNVNKYKMVRDFTNYLSVSPINYLIHRRIEIAKKLLRTTTLSIHEISYSVGIENTSHFINLFKKSTNITPSNYRKRYDSNLIALSL